jgi:hypothetical protein
MAVTSVLRLDFTEPSYFNVSNMPQVWHQSMRVDEAIPTRYVALSHDNSLTSYGEHSDLSVFPANLINEQCCDYAT